MPRVLAKVRSLVPPNHDVPWCVPNWSARERGLVLKSIMGRLPSADLPEHVAQEIAAAVGVKYGLPLNRGRTAIEIALRAMGIGAGSDVVIPAYICRTAVEGVLGSGARPVFADIGPRLHVSMDSVLAALTPATRCVVVPHLFGGTAPIDDIAAVLAPRGVAVLDDAAQGFGARLKGRRVGSFGRCGVVGIGSGKALAGPAGAVLVTDDQALYEEARRLAPSSEPRGVVTQRALQFLLWRRWRRWAFPTELIADRLRLWRLPPHRGASMSALDAAIVGVQLARMTETAASRREHARQFLEALGPCAAWNVTPVDADSAALKLALVLPEGGPTPAEAIQTLLAAGVESQAGYASCAQSEDERVRTPNAQRLAPRVLTIALEAALPARTKPRVMAAARALYDRTLNNVALVARESVERRTADAFQA